MLNRLALLVRDPLGDHFAVNLLNVLASGDRLLSGSLLWGVGADLCHYSEYLNGIKL